MSPTLSISSLEWDCGMSAIRKHVAMGAGNKKLLTDSNTMEKKKNNFFELHKTSHWMHRKIKWERRVWHGKGKTLHIVHETFKSVIRWKVALFPPKQYWNQNKYFILISIDFNTRMCFFAFFFRSFRLAFRYSKTEGYRDISIWSFAFKKKTPRRRRKTFPPCSEHKTSRRGTFCLNPSAKFLILKQKFGIKCQQSEKHIIWAYLAALIGSVWSSRRNSSSRSSPAW